MAKLSAGKPRQRGTCFGDEKIHALILDTIFSQSQRRRRNLWRRFRVGIRVDLWPVLVIAILGQGCASVATAPVVTTRTSSAEPAKYFTLQGRISVRVSDRLDTGKIQWSKLVSEERLQLFTPFGSQVAELVKTANGIVTLRRDKEMLTAATIDELTTSLLGVPLDMEAIAAWTQGIGLNENEETGKKFANGDVWQVTAERFQFYGAHRVASRLSAIRGDTVVRLVVDEWRAE